MTPTTIAGIGHLYLATIELGRRAPIRRVEIRWRWHRTDRAAMTIDAISFVDRRTGRAYPVSEEHWALFAEPEHWQVVPDAGYDIFENRSALPDVSVASKAVAATPQEALAAIRGAGPEGAAPFDYRTTVLTERAMAIGPASREDRVLVRSLGDTKASFDVRCAAACLLVQSAAAYPGWVANVDGAPAKIETVDGALRGILVPPGSHDVQLAFRPRVLIVGSALSALALAALILLLIGRAPMPLKQR